MQQASKSRATVEGFIALSIWSLTIAVARGATEALGAMTCGGLAMLAGGIGLMLTVWAKGLSPGAMLKLPRKYLLVCGGLFVVYELCIFAAIGYSPSRSATLVAGLVNYMWPALTVVLSVPILARRARWTLGPGVLLAVAGSAAAILSAEQFQWAQLRQSGPVVAFPLALAAGGAVSWGLYCNLVKRWGDPRAGAVPLFLIVSGVLLTTMGRILAEQPTWTAKAIGELIFLAVFQSALAYWLWERGMRRGNHLLLSLASYFMPIAAMAVAAAYLHVLPGPGLWIGCGLVTGGALICRASLTDGPELTP